MPEYLAPGVFVEETSFRSKSIEGVSTTTTGFIGPARTGPVDLAPDIITSLGEFEEVYGDGNDLQFDGGSTMTNYLWQAVRAFFANGGKRLYISRVFKPMDGSDTTPRRYAPIDADLEATAGVDIGSGGMTLYQDGHARAASLLHTGLVVRARHPGAAGNARVRFTLKAAGNILSVGVDPITRKQATNVGALRNRDLIWAADRQSPHDDGQGNFYLALWDEDMARWTFESVPTRSPGGTLTLDELFPSPDIAMGDAIRIVTLNVSVLARDGSSEIGTWAGLPFDPEHRTGTSRDSVFDYFATVPNSASDAIRLPLVVARDSAKMTSAADVLMALFGHDPGSLLLPSSEEVKRRITVADKLTMGVYADALLDGGNDGERPGAGDYEGEAFLDKHYSLGLKQFEDLDDISIVAAPGSTWDYAHYSDDADAIQLLLIGHAEYMRYRIAVLDSAEGQSISEVRNMRARLDSKYAALYYPWVTVLDPIRRQGDQPAAQRLRRRHLCTQ